MHTLQPFVFLSRAQARRPLALMTGACVLILLAGLAQAVDLVNLAAVGGPLVSALTTLSTLTPGVKALIGFLTFVVAFISLAALRSFGPVLFYVGVMIFGSAGLVLGGAILGAVA